jgi:hypothetical protein
MTGGTHADESRADAGPLKRVIGESAGIGRCSGNLTIAWP